MNNIRNATCKLDGIAESVFLASGQISEKTVAQEFCLGNPVYNSGSATDGTLSASISVFGFDTEISGFDANVDDWEDEVNSDIDI